VANKNQKEKDETEQEISRGLVEKYQLSSPSQFLTGTFHLLFANKNTQGHFCDDQAFNS